MPNSCELIIFYFALLRIKAVGCFLNIRFPIEETLKQLKTINSKRIISNINSFSNNDSLKDFEMINSNDILKNAKKEETDTQIKSYDLKAPASIIFTSGSTEESKAALHSFSNHFYSAQGSEKNIPLHKEDAWVLTLPMFHVGGLSIIFRCFLAGACIIIQESGASLINTIEHSKATHISLVPTQLYRLLNSSAETVEKLRHLKCILIGGSYISKNLLDHALENNLSIHLTYGLTEMSSQVATSKKLTLETKEINAEILPFREAKITHQGEIVLRGDVLFQGYLKDGNLQKDCFIDGWVPTGDLGQLIEDKFLKVLGRLDNMFISGGENIYPEEIEKALHQLDTIEQTLVIPVANQEFGFRPVAFIKEKEGAEVKKADLCGAIQKSLPKFMTPDEFYYWPEEIEKFGIKPKRKEFLKILQTSNHQLKRFK